MDMRVTCLSTGSTVEKSVWNHSWQTHSSSTPSRRSDAYALGNLRWTIRSNA